jgi:hypothetical protein
MVDGTVQTVLSLMMGVICYSDGTECYLIRKEWENISGVRMGE